LAASTYSAVLPLPSADPLQLQKVHFYVDQFLWLHNKNQTNIDKTRRKPQSDLHCT